MVDLHLDRRCDRCEHPAGEHAYGEWDRAPRGRCTRIGCECKSYAFDYVAALEREVQRLRTLVQSQ